MIGQSIINVKSGGRGRLSSFAAGVFLLFWWWCWAIWSADPDARAGRDHDHGVDRHLLLVLDQATCARIRARPRS
jgi:hypothetical protein